MEQRIIQEPTGERGDAKVGTPWKAGYDHKSAKYCVPIIAKSSKWTLWEWKIVFLQYM